MTKAQNEVAVVETKGALTLAEQGMGFMDMGDMMMGMENMDADSMSIPFIQLLQKMSPMVDPDDPAYVEGALAGMLFNTVTNQLYNAKVGVKIIPVFYKRSFILWGGREAAESGFKGEFTVEEFDEIMKEPGRVVEDKGRYFVPDEDGKFDVKKSDYYADTRSHYIMIENPLDGSWSEALLSLSSSQIKPSKMLMTMLSQKRIRTPKGPACPPSFYNIVTMSTIGMSNDKGSWSGAKFELTGAVDADTFAQAKAFYMAVRDGDRTVDRTKEAGANSEREVNEKPVNADQF